MRGVSLQIQMLLRRKVANLLVIGFVLASTVFLLTYPGLIRQAQQELAHAYDTVRVTGWIVNIEDYESPSLSRDAWHAVVDSGILGSQYSVLDVGVYILDAETTELVFSDQNNSNRQDIYWKALGQQRDYIRTLHAVSNWQAHGDLSRQIEQVSWAVGYDRTCLESGEMVCILPEELGYLPGQSAAMLLLPTNSAAIVQSRKIAPVLVELPVAGVYPKAVDYDDRGYIPILAMEEFCQEQEWIFTVNHFQFEVGDNRRLDELKQILREQGLGTTSRTVKAAIDDRILEGTVAPVQSNIEMLRGLYGILFLMVAFIGFFLCFLLAKDRKPEYAVMRLLGESTAQVTIKALLEQMILCACGIVLGILILMIAGQGNLNVTACGIILVCYTIGAALAVLLTVHVNVMDILRDKE